MAERRLRVLALSKYGPLGASSRLRILQYVPWLAKAAVEVTVQSLICDELLLARYRSGRYPLAALGKAYSQRILYLLRHRDFDVLWIEKEALPWLPLTLERQLLKGIPYVLDYDDAVFHHYDQHPRQIVRLLMGHRLDGLMAHAALVVGCNEYLTRHALAAGAARLAILPTVLDIDRYPVKPTPSNHLLAGQAALPCIVWIGSPSTLVYLAELGEVLARVAVQTPYRLRVIGGSNLMVPGVTVECLPWTLDSEAELISSADVGIMPLRDSSWEQGKCGYKLIQYMACGLPVVASGIGVNGFIVDHGVNGYLANSQDEWVSHLTELLQNSVLRQRFGASGRQRVAQCYCVQHTWHQLAASLWRAVGKS